LRSPADQGNAGAEQCQQRHRRRHRRLSQGALVA
jgi:hypothetical protein